LKMAGAATNFVQGSLHPVFARPEAASSSEAWKKIIGNQPIAARLEPLPGGKPRWSALLTSTVFQAALAAFLCFVPTLFPSTLVNKNIYEVVAIVAPQTEVPLPPPPVPAKTIPRVSPLQETPEPQRAAKLMEPRELRPLVAAKPKPPRATAVNVPDVPDVNDAAAEPKVEAKLEGPAPDLARPREPVKMGTLSEGAASAATVNKPAEHVQTGGFGDPNGLPGGSEPNKRPNVAALGSPALPPGPGYGNGTAGLNGARGTVASAGFGDGAATSQSPSGEGPRSAVKPGGFDTTVTGSDAPKPKQPEGPAPVQPVVILSKPQPEYSAEARQLGLEGEVLLEVIFPTSGPVQVVRVVHGLGHGLDEAAARAAQQIRFKPALQEGKPVDFHATLHIDFQLAF